jgi:hypothetical protein
MLTSCTVVQTVGVACDHLIIGICHGQKLLLTVNTEMTELISHV